jgi:hypothetical protein
LGRIAYLPPLCRRQATPFSPYLTVTDPQLKEKSHERGPKRLAQPRLHFFKSACLDLKQQQLFAITREELFVVKRKRFVMAGSQEIAVQFNQQKYDVPCRV